MHEFPIVIQHGTPPGALTPFSPWDQMVPRHIRPCLPPPPIIARSDTSAQQSGGGRRSRVLPRPTRTNRRPAHWSNRDSPTVVCRRCTLYESVQVSASCRRYFCPQSEKVVHPSASHAIARRIFITHTERVYAVE